MKKHGRRHKLLRHKLSMSEGESGEEKSAAKEKKKGTKKSKQKGGFVWFKCCIQRFGWNDGRGHENTDHFMLIC